LLLVFTAQNRQPRVQVSPSTMMVAVAMPSPSPPAPPPPFQHYAPKATATVNSNTKNQSAPLAEIAGADQLKQWSLIRSRYAKGKGSIGALSYLADVGALGFDADGVELELADGLPQASVLLPLRRPLPQPRGLLHLGVPPGVRPHRRPSGRAHRRRRLGAAPRHGDRAARGPAVAAPAATIPHRRTQRPRERALHRGRRNRGAGLRGFVRRGVEPRWRWVRSEGERFLVSPFYPLVFRSELTV
jgi:hypothetical protein